MAVTNWVVIGILLGAIIATVVLVLRSNRTFFKQSSKAKPLSPELQKEKESLVAERDKLTANPPNSFSLEKIVSQATLDEQKLLFEVLKKKDISPEKAVKIICAKGSHTIATCWRRVRGNAPHVEYDVVVRDVAKAVKTRKVGLVPEIEKRIIEKVFQNIEEKLEPEERKKLTAAIAAAKTNHQKSITGEIVGGAAIGAAQLSGFGVYLMASTVVGGISQVAGVALPFAFYTGMSSTISVLIGPIGIALLATAFVHKLGSPNYKVTVPAVIVIAAIRSRLNVEFEGKIIQIDHRLREIDRSVI